MQQNPRSIGHRLELRSCPRFCGTLFIALAWLALDAVQAQNTTCVLGTTNLLVGPAAGSNSVVLAVAPQTGLWTATNNTPWLHLSPSNQNGAGSTNVIFSFDANPGPTRSGALTIGGQTLTVTQAGSTYTDGATVTTLLSPQIEPVGTEECGVAVDGMGNAYTLLLKPPGLYTYFDEWKLTNNSLVFVNLPCKIPSGAANILAVDGAGNVYVADIGDNAIKEWMSADGNVATLVSVGLNQPVGVAVDAAGNVYIADFGDNAIKEWTPANSNLTTLVASGLTDPWGLAVDVAGNVYISDGADTVIREWIAASSNLITLVDSGLTDPDGLAVDGAGNVYISDTGAVKKWTAANNTLSTLFSVPYSPLFGVAVDGAGNLYVADETMQELPYAFVDATPKLESLAAGNDSLPAVLPITANLLPPFAPTSDQPWLNITAITNGVVSFSFTANTGPARTGHIALLGQNIPITQGVIGTPPTLTGVQMLSGGVLQFTFTNIPGASFTVLSTTNLALPLREWTVAGAATNTAPTQFQFTSQSATNEMQIFYRVRSGPGLAR